MMAYGEDLIFCPIARICNPSDSQRCFCFYILFKAGTFTRLKTIA